MLTNGNKGDCGLADAMISYVYDESTEVERRKFEVHLSVCSVCTDEFAAISSARFSVFEWQKEEFAQVETPSIVIPYPPRPAIQAAPLSFVEQLRGLFAFPGIAVGAAAAVLLSIALGYVFVIRNTGETRIASEPGLPAIAPETERKDPQVPAAVDVKEERSPSVGASVVPEVPSTGKREGDGVRATSRKTATPRPHLANVKQKRLDLSPLRQNHQARQAPVLSERVEMDDRSLRLSDLLDEGGGSLR